MKSDQRVAALPILHPPLRPLHLPPPGRPTCHWNLKKKKAHKRVGVDFIGGVANGRSILGGQTWSHLSFSSPWLQSAALVLLALASTTVDNSFMISLKIFTSKGMFVQRSGSNKNNLKQ